MPIVSRPATQWVPPDDDRYPLQLRGLPSSPALHIRGAIGRDDALAIAIVGSRRATSYGLGVAETLARDLAARGVTVVSGLARGIDAAAHRGALRGGGRTIGVLGCGIDRIYPPGHETLAEEIIARGALVSQFSPDAPPLPQHFPLRNAVIAGLALGVVVVEASESSGALITARHAGEFGRLVFAVPGSVTAPESRGTHGLLRDGATLVRDWTDIVSELPALWRDCVRVTTEADPPRGTVSGDEGAVLSLLGATPVALETLIARGGLGPGRTSAALVTLEVRGLARQLAGLAYIRVS